MVRILLGVTVRDSESYEWIKEQTKLVELRCTVALLEWNLTNGQIQVDEAYSRDQDQKNDEGQSPIRWVNDIRGSVGRGCIGMAQNRLREPMSSTGRM